MKKRNPLLTDLPVIHLKPGEIHFSEKPELVTTILGSCVSFTMFAPQQQIAAICHAVLPTKKSNLRDQLIENEFKYLDSSFYTMLEWFANRGVHMQNLVIKIFGGGEVLDIGSPFNEGKSIGAQNIEIAFQLMLSHNLVASSQDVSGRCGRRLFFYTHTGDVLIKRTRTVSHRQSVTSRSAKKTNDSCKEKPTIKNE